MLAMILGAIGCDEEELAPARAPSDLMPAPTCVDAAWDLATPTAPIPLGAFTPPRRPRAIQISTEGLELYADTPEGAWLRGVQPPAHTPLAWWSGGPSPYRYGRDPTYAPRFRRGRSRWR